MLLYWDLQKKLKMLKIEKYQKREKLTCNYAISSQYEKGHSKKGIISIIS